MDVHPGDFKESDMVWEMQYMGANFEEQTFEVEIISPKGFSSGRHTLYAQARDSDDYVGPVSSAFFDVERKETATPSKDPTESPSPAPTTDSPSSAPISAVRFNNVVPFVVRYVGFDDFIHARISVVSFSFCSQLLAHRKTHLQHQRLPRLQLRPLQM